MATTARPTPRPFNTRPVPPEQEPETPHETLPERETAPPEPSPQLSHKDNALVFEGLQAPKHSPEKDFTHSDEFKNLPDEIQAEVRAGREAMKLTSGKKEREHAEGKRLLERHTRNKTLPPNS